MRAPPSAKPATTKIGAPAARPAMAASDELAATSISPAMRAGMMSSPFGKTHSSIRSPWRAPISFMYETAP